MSPGSWRVVGEGCASGRSTMDVVKYVMGLLVGCEEVAISMRIHK